MADNPTLLTRRAAIRHAVTLLGGTLTVAQLGLLTESVAAMTEDSAPRFLSEEQFLVLRRIVDLIIPETDTPGALGANVHHFVDLMLAEWASPARQTRYVAGLDDIDKRARGSGATGFSASSVTRQAELLRTLDKEAFADRSANSFFGELKKMVVFAYYSSEVGATVELRYQRIPVDYLPCVPMEDIDRAWFWNGYSYEL